MTFMNQVFPECERVPLRRRGPRPLSVHLGLAASIWGAAEGGQDNLPSDPPGTGVSNRMLRMLTGIRKYHEHPYVRVPSAQEVVWAQGSARLLYYPAVKASGQAVFLIPSLVNGAAILDLMPRRSLVAWLGEQGISSFLLDWGALAEDAMEKPGQAGAGSFDALFSSRILPALTAAHTLARGPVHVLGYCMGGLLAAATACLAPESVRSLIMVASPWDFHAGDQTLSARVRGWAPGARSMAESLGRLPVDWLQILFASVDPLMAAHKFIRFADLPGDSDEALMFVAVEDWLSGGGDLPAGIARTCIEGWYRDNSTARGAWEVLGKVIDPEDISCPAFVVASAVDRLVPMDSSLAFCARRAAGLTTTLAPDCGHIGMMAGRRSISGVWTPIEKWIAAH